jgi:hypothetical protein
MIPRAAVMISFACWSCDQPMEVAQSEAGRTRDCPRCGKPVRVPGGSESDADAERTTFPSPPRAVDEHRLHRSRSASRSVASGLEVALAVFAAVVMVLGCSLSLVWFDRSFNDRDKSINALLIPSFGPFLLALSAIALSVALSGRSPAVVRGIGWGLLVFVIVWLVRILQLWELQTHEIAEMLRSMGARVTAGGVGPIHIAWETALFLVVGPLLFVGAGWAGCSRQKGEGHP